MTSTTRPRRTYSGSAVCAFLTTGNMIKPLSREQLLDYLDMWRARLDRAPDRTFAHAVAVGAKLAVENELERVGGK